MANSYEIIKIKQLAISKIIQQKNIVELLEDNQIGNPEALINENIFPFDRVPEIEEEQKNYITLQVDSSKSGIMKNVILYVTIIAHQKLMMIPEMGATRIDLLSAYIDELFNGSDDFGLGEMELISNLERNIDINHRCRVMKFTCKAFDKSMCG